MVSPLMSNKPQVKPEPRYFYLWRRTNTFDEERTLDALSIMHFITPVAHGKLSCLAEKFQAIFGSVYSPPTSTKISPLFEFLLFRQVGMDYISPDFRKTDALTIMVDELCKGLNKIRDEVKIQRIAQAAGKVYREFYDSNKFEQGKEQQPQDRLRQSNDRVVRLRELETLQLKRMEDYLREYRKEWREDEVLGSEGYARLQFEQVRKMELLSMPQQYTRWKSFETLHKKSFSCQYVEDKRNRPYIYSLKMNRPSVEVEPVLMRLADHLQLRDTTREYGPESQVFIKDLLQQLKKYHMDTSSFETEEKQFHFYPYTSPESVLFDQITLRPKLSYEPLLLDLFGLRKRPVSSEGMIVWFCTPKEFDFFQGEDEFNDNMKLRLADPYHGTNELYSRPVPKDSVLQQRKEVQQAKERICIDRFLLTSYYLNNGTEFGRPHKHTSYQQIETHFLERVANAKKNIRSDATLLKDFVGEVASGASGAFGFRFGQLVESLSVQEVDSVLEGQRYLRVVRYLNLRYTLIRELVSVLTNDRLFQKLSNAKKYIMLYLVLGVQNLEELRLLCVEGNRLNDIPLLRRYIEDNGKKLRNGKSAEHSLESTLVKILEYRGKASKENNKFMLEDEGRKLVDKCTQLKQLLAGERASIDQICAVMEKPESSKEVREAARVKVVSGRGKLARSIEDYSRSLLDFCKSEMKMKYANGPHRLPEEKDVGELYQLVTRRFELTLHAFLNSSTENFLVYDFMLLRLLHADDPEHFNTLSTAAPAAVKEQLTKAERDALNAADDIVGLSVKKNPEPKPDDKRVLPKTKQDQKYGMEVQQPKKY